MGYRSDVRIVTSQKGFEKLKDFVTNKIANSQNPNMYNLMENLSFGVMIRDILIKRKLKI